MYTKQEIILKSHREGKSQRLISKELGISRKTVKKYITEFEARLQSGSPPQEAITKYLSNPPVYHREKREKLKLTVEVQQAIDELLAANEEKRLQGLRKQLLKKCDIHSLLQEQGIDIGYTTVCNYIKEKQGKTALKEAYIRQDYIPGAVCEFDWGEIKLYIAGKLTRFQLAVFTAAYSNYRYAEIYQRQDTLAFMESHVSFFEHLQGVYKEMVYDNMRVAVSKFIGPHEKEPTRALLQLRGHYHFSHRFCNSYRGNEKGHVERSVEYIRRKSFAVKCHFTDVEEATAWLHTKIAALNNTRQKLTGKTANELLGEERTALLVLPNKLLCSDQIQLRVDKYATVSYKTNRYSVPDHLVGEFVQVKIMSHELWFYHNDYKVATHHRSYNLHDWIIKIDHYLDTFKRKPGALAGSMALASSRYLKELYEDHFMGEPRNFIELLDYCRQHAITDEKLAQAVIQLTGSPVKQLTTEKIKALLGNKQDYFEPLKWTQTTAMAKSQLQQLSTLIN
ncbi:IS21 family transposase [Zunongwangia sp. H14]|uniref:IS21 family transposase n=1 Tax=Zunongwangia sp. H14 TaxID=3240792 RepID=UPI003567949E